MAGTAEIRSRAGLDNSGFITGIKGMQRETEAWAKGQLNQLKGQIAGAFSVGAVIAFGKSIVDCAKDLQDQADTLNVTTDSLQAFQKVARENGSDQDKLATALTKTQTAQMELLAGTDKMVAAFGALGIKAKDVEGLGTDEVFALIGQKVYEADDQTAAFNATTDILGSKLAGNLIPTLKAVGEDGLQTVIDKAKESGEVLSADVIAKIDMFGDRLEALAKKAKVLAVDVADTVSAQAEGILSFWAAWIAGDDLDTAAAKSQKAINDVYETQDLAVQKAVAAQQKGNELILETTTKTADQQVKEADRVALARELGVKKVVDAEERYNERVEKLALGRMPLEDKIVALRAKQSELLALIGEAEEKGLGRTLETFDLKNKLLDVQQELSRAEGDTSKKSAEVTDNVKQSTDQAEKLRTEIGKMNVFEVGTLIKNMKLLQLGLQAISDSGGFPEINIPDLSGLELPDWMLKGNAVDKVRNFIDALAGLARGLAGGKFEGLEKLKDLDFKLPDTTKVDLKGLAEILKATKDAKFGSLSLTVDYPDAGIPLDVSNLKLDSIEESLAVLAGMKGVIWN